MRRVDVAVTPVHFQWNSDVLSISEVLGNVLHRFATTKLRNETNLAVSPSEDSMSYAKGNVTLNKNTTSDKVYLDRAKTNQGLYDKLVQNVKYIVMSKGGSC